MAARSESAAMVRGARLRPSGFDGLLTMTLRDQPDPDLMKCHRDGCDSAAAYHVGLELACIGVGRHRQMLRAPTSLKVCYRHMRDAVAYVLSPANKSAIAAGLARRGFPLPDFSSAELVFVPIGAPENDFAARESARH
jgi:hypothetical protein